MEWLFLMIIPMGLAMWAQARVHSAYAQGMRLEAPLSGAQAARFILDRNGLENIRIEEVGGTLSDHYDPSHKVLRLSSEVYHVPSIAAVAIAAHEAGHALQHARGYAPLVIRSLAAPAAIAGPWLSMILLMLGVFMHSQPLIWLGIAAFGGILFFQLINLPVEFDASDRAKLALAEAGIVSGPENTQAVNSVLNAAAWTYVAATLQTLVQFLYYVVRFGGVGSRRDE